MRLSPLSVAFKTQRPRARSRLCDFDAKLTCTPCEGPEGVAPEAALVMPCRCIAKLTCTMQAKEFSGRLGSGRPVTLDHVLDPEAVRQKQPLSCHAAFRSQADMPPCPQDPEAVRQKQAALARLAI